MYSNQQIHELLQAIQIEHLSFIAETIGVEVLSQEEISLLSGKEEDLREESYIEYAFKFGMITMATNDPRAKKMSFERLKDFISSGSFLPLTTYERDVVNRIKRRSYTDIKGLGNKIERDFSNILIEVDQKQRSKYERVISKEIAQGAQRRENVKQIVSRLGHATADWSRDFGRIADYVMHQAFDEGRASQILKESGQDSLVYKDVYEKACFHCVKAYLTAGPGSEPKQFKLSELLSNGTNIGVKQKDWKPVIGPSHPFCRCTLNRVPSGFLWDQKNRGFIIPDSNFGRKVARNSKVNVTVGDKKYTI